MHTKKSGAVIFTESVYVPLNAASGTSWCGTSVTGLSPLRKRGDPHTPAAASADTGSSSTISNSSSSTVKQCRQTTHTHTHRTELKHTKVKTQSKESKERQTCKRRQQGKRSPPNQQLKLRKLRSVPKQVMHRAAKTSEPQCGWGEEHRCRKGNGDFTEMEHSGIQKS